jgi:hypothetical protein
VFGDCRLGVPAYSGYADDAGLALRGGWSSHLMGLVKQTTGIAPFAALADQVIIAELYASARRGILGRGQRPPMT